MTLVLVELHVRNISISLEDLMRWFGLQSGPADLLKFKLDQKSLVNLCLTNKEKIKFKSECFLLYVDNTRVTGKIIHREVNTTSSINSEMVKW